MDKNILLNYHRELEAELHNILDWWQTRMIDRERGGFYGRIDGEGRLHADAPKGLVLNARILWTFSAAARALRDPALTAVAQRAYEYLTQHFLDAELGGAYWSVHADGKALDTRKQTYGLAFAIYGLSEYARLTNQAEPLAHAQALFRWVEKHSFDFVRGGYLEAVARDGSPLADIRLSEEDRNDPKSMNTHLHLLEAYANLYRVWRDPALAQQLRHLLNLFLDHIIDPLSGHLRLFFDLGWMPQSTEISYGHDIEASWLLLEAAEVLGDSALIQKCRDNAVIMAIAAARGLDTDGGLWCENHLQEKHWWPQAEAMAGFYNAWQLSGEEHFLEKSFGCWRFAQRFLIDHRDGEWHWGMRADYSTMQEEDKAGFWKCPYHTGRACLEIIKNKK